MRKLIVASLVLGLAWCATSYANQGNAIKEAMKICMKGGLCGKVAKGEASAEEKTKLAELLKAMAAAKPPKGSEESWKEKAGALATAAAEIADGKDSSAKLKAAANCMACHKEHK